MVSAEGLVLPFCFSFCFDYIHLLLIEFYFSLNKGVGNFPLNFCYLLGLYESRICNFLGFGLLLDNVLKK